VAKRKMSDNNSDSKRKATSESNSLLSLEERVQDSTTPLWRLSYADQVKQKKSHIQQILRKCLLKIESVNRATCVFYWLQKQRKLYEGMCCELVEFVDSPIQDNYRNKCEFTIGYDREEKKKLIGSRLGDFKSGSNEVVEPYCCKHIPIEMKSLVKLFQSYIETSDYNPFNVRTHEGHWRQLTVRTNELNEMLAIIVFDKQKLTDEQIEMEKNKLAAFLKQRNDPEYAKIKLKSILFNINHNSQGISKLDNLDEIYSEGNDDCKKEEPCLYENLLDLKFRISPLAFFQANTKAAEKLYSKIGDICDIDENTIVLDICCGTGTIGLTLAKRCRLIVGVEIIAEAIEDAKRNSDLNGIKNVEYHCGKAEDVLPDILKRFYNDKVVAIVDPPRAGLRKKLFPLFLNALMIEIIEFSLLL
jgi:tRNA (uracil-5-)-methyltransferase